MGSEFGLRGNTGNALEETSEFVVTPVLRGAPAWEHLVDMAYKLSLSLMTRHWPSPSGTSLILNLN